MKVDQFLKQRKVSIAIQEVLEDILVGLAVELNLDEESFLEDDYKVGSPQYIIYPYVFRAHKPVLPKIAKYFNSVEHEMHIYDSLVFEATKKLSMSKLRIMDTDEGGEVYLTFKQRRRLDPVYFEISAF